MQKESIIAQELSSYSLIERFDSACCRLLANKPILAWLLQGTLEEYRTCTIGEIMDCLDDHPTVRSVAVDQDIKGKESGKIIEKNTADKSVTEGPVFYDILFTSRLPNTNGTCEVIINVENQNRWNPGYPLLKRAVYYCGRLISRQKGTVFFGDDYGKLEKVYSIWICLKVPKAWQETITLFSLTPKPLVGTGKYDKMEYDMETIAVLGLGDYRGSRKDILKLLSVLLTPEMKPEKKKEILEQDFSIPMTVEMKKEADTMCTYGQAILEKGREQGIEEGKKQGIAIGEGQGSEKERRRLLITILENGMSVEQAAAWTNIPVEYVRKLAEELKK